MFSFGIPHEDIATLLVIDAKTLRNHFRRELDRGLIKATTKIAQSLLNMATSGNNAAAAIFWMKAPACWRERHDVPFEANPYAHMTDEGLRAERKRINEIERFVEAHAEEMKRLR
jgi:hypothetical protein